MPEEASTTDTRALLAPPGQPAGPAPGEAPPGGFDVWLLVVFALLFGAVALSNVWLRRRADRERRETE